MVTQTNSSPLIWLLVAVFGVGGCAKKAPPQPIAAPQPVAAPRPTAAPQPVAANPPPTITTSVTVTASPEANPDSTGRPSPIVVRVYQLKADAAFSAAEFFALFDDEQKVLGSGLISRDEFVVAPSERRTVSMTISDDARFVGVLAAFRDIRNSQWRALAPTPRKGMTVVVERARVLFFVLQ